MHVAPGDTVAAEDPLLTLESDKATLDVPSPVDGTVTWLTVSVGDTVSQGTVIGTVETTGGAHTPPKERVREVAHPEPESPASYGSPAGVYDRLEVAVPEIGDFADVPVIEVHVAVGDTVAAEDPLITLETDKATMDVPAPTGGTVTAVKVSVGDTVSVGLIVDLSTGQAGHRRTRRQPRPRQPRPRRGGAAAAAAPAPYTGPRVTCTPRCWCWAPGPAATRPRSGRRTWAARSSWWTPAARWAGCASTWAVSRPRRCCTPRR